MTKKILSISIFLLLFSCSQELENKTKNNLELLNLKGKVKSYREITYQANIINGVVQKGQRVNSRTLCETFYSFNTEGKTTEISHYDEDKILSDKYNFIWDAKGNMIEHNSTHQNNTYRTLFKFDNNNHLVSVSNYKGDSLIVSQTVKNIFDNEKLIEAISINKNGEQDGKNIWKYDEKGNVLEDSRYDPKNDFYWKQFYKYDEKYNIIEYRIETKINESYETQIHNYKYNDNGKKIEETYKSSYDGDLTYIKYNSNGDISEKNYLDTKEVLTEIIYGYELDENNNWYKQMEYRNGKANYIREREIEYY